MACRIVYSFTSDDLSFIILRVLPTMYYNTRGIISIKRLMCRLNNIRRRHASVIEYNFVSYIAGK